MNKAFIVYKTDVVHSYASRDILGISLFGDPVSIVLQQAEKEGETVSEEQLFNLRSFSQTQGYLGEGEFHIEPVELDTLL